jgi:hypothetical protein
VATERGRTTFDRWVDIASVVLISVAAVLTAWCGYEAARWTGLQTRDYSQANAYRISASEASARANTLTTIDVATFLRYVATVAEGQTAERTFLYNRFRPEMKRAVDAWLATKPLVNPRAPSSPFVMRQYQLAARAQEDVLKSQAAKSFDAAQAANELSDEYVRLTIIFATVSFLAGISTKFVYPSHIVVVAVGFAALIYGMIRVFDLPLR